MNNYLTPIKQHGHKSSNTFSHQKPSDWVCLLCNNLNFSFRKKCNRCKIQTRHQNHIATAYSHYYYEQRAQVRTNSPASHFQLKTKEKQKKNEQNKEYPSISPLVKKYQRKEAQTTTEGKGEECESRERKEVFSNDLWKDIQIRDFDEVCKEGGDWQSENGNMSDCEIEILINKILL